MTGIENTRMLAVITGCDSGIGKSLCRIMADRGYTVVLSYLDRNPFPDESGFFAFKMDLRKEGDIDSFIFNIKKLIKGGYQLKFLINNAGVALGGPVEDISMEIFREVFEINFFGVVSLTQMLIPLLVTHKGRIVIIGSLAGRIAFPFLSPYASSKFALEGFADSLRREMLPFGVKTILIEPAGIATPIWEKAKNQDSSYIGKKYTKSVEEFKRKFIETGMSSMNVDKAAFKIFQKIIKRKPKSRYIISQNLLASYFQLLIPGRVLDRMILKLFSMDYGKEE